MLEQLRQNSRNFIIWVLFAIIIAAFVFTFGTQGEVSFAGGGGGGDYVMVVDDQEVSVHSWRFGMNTLRGGMDKASRSQMVLDALLERELLAQAAAAAGFRATGEMAYKRIFRGEFNILGQPVDGRNMYFRNGDFDYDLLKTQVQAMGLPTVDEFIEEQTRELEAQHMRELMLRSVLASPEEAQTRYIYENTKVTVDVVPFRISAYRRAIALSQADLDAYLADYASEVEAKYDADAALYKDRGKELRVRQIVLRRQQPKTLRPGAEEPEPAGPTDPALVAAREIHAQLAAGADFAEIARERSEDERSQAKGGDLGWRSAENPGLGFPELAEAVQALSDGEITEVIEVPRGYYILKVEASREGNLDYEQVKYEIAERMAIEHYAEEAARRDAERALERARAAVAEGQALDALFEREAGPPARPSGLENLPPNLTPEQLQEILRGMQEQGSVTVEGPDRPAEASWQGAEPPAAPADQAGAAPTGPAGGSAAGAAPTGPAGGSAAGSAAATAADSAGIPVAPDLVRPNVRKIGPFTRDPEGVIRGIGSSHALMSALFDELGAGDLTGQVYEVGESFVIAQLVSRQEPNLETFQENRAERVQNLGFERGFRNLRTWLEKRCNALIEVQKVGVNRALMNQLATEKEGEEFTYRPRCASL